MTGFLPAPYGFDASWARAIVERINNILRGKLNAQTTITLTANSGTTTLTDARIGLQSVIILDPKTTNANAAKYTAPYIIQSNQLSGSVLLTHVNDANLDKSFNVFIVG